jgi:hypothetical protein
MLIKIHVLCVCVLLLLLPQGLVLQEDLKARMRVLRRLGYIDTGELGTQLTPCQVLRPEWQQLSVG